ncbi:hypothetical protein AWC17_25990 [Mycobacterium nebraskense]|uniref:MFS transporter n=1 Tax=Mycobacterium nebraskense TaxID=244292 RepID=A0A1X1ZYG8_9MYCO|nr:hypothetical protein AWC17_25990 [Mycobacterium nebraskense]
MARLCALPQPVADPAAEKASILAYWRIVAGNRLFLLFGAAMIGSYVLMFQIYLELPVRPRS